MKVLILGARGRLGATLVREWSGRHEVTGLGRAEVDVADPVALRDLLGRTPFDVLVNASGLTNVDLCESRRDEAWQVNAVAPGLMAAVAGRKGARFLHFSTDYVFDGRQPGARREDEPTAPLGWYGATKREGEVRVLEQPGDPLVLRVSWVFGPDKPAFPDTLIQRALVSDRVEAISDKFSTPTYAVDVAGWIEPFFDPAPPGGIYHVCNTGGCSWQEYGAHALRCAHDAGVPVRTVEVAPLALSEMKAFVAPRPVHTILSNEKLASVTGLTPRPWQDALRDHIQSHHAPLPPSA